MRVGACADELCIIFVGMSWVAADGSGGMRRRMLWGVSVCMLLFGLCGVRFVIDCVVIFVSSCGWFCVTRGVLYFLSDLRLYVFGVWEE